MVVGETVGKQQDPPLQLNQIGDGETALLVGPRNEGEVVVNGIKCRALIDSGSQITSITHKYWRNHPVLQRQRLQPSRVHIEGAAGQSVGYHGVLRLDLKVLGREFKNVPAFVVTDSEYRSSVPLLVGTNVLRASRSHLQATYGQQFLHQVKVSHPEWYASLLEIEGTKQCDEDETVGPAVYVGRKIHIPPGKEMDLMCKVKAGPQRKTYSAMIAGHYSLQLPEDLLVARVFANVKRGSAPVRVMNLSQRAITIRPQTHLANVSLVTGVVNFADKELGQFHNAGNKDTCLSLNQVVEGSKVDLSETAVESERQRALLKDLVDRNAGVFSQHPLDYGHTKTAARNSSG